MIINIQILDDKGNELIDNRYKFADFDEARLLDWNNVINTAEDNEKSNREFFSKDEAEFNKEDLI